MLSFLLLLAAVGMEPVIRVDVPYPTADKPQSKVWFAHGSWWAWLPVKGGSGVWKRGGKGWTRELELRGQPGQADVWADEKAACAVLVDERRLAVACLEWAGAGYQWKGKPVEIGMTGEGKLETATIARDGRGEWWIAYGWAKEMWVRRSGDGWKTPEKVSETLAAADDICAVVALREGIGVVWSDQAADTVWFRRRGKSWAAPEVIEKGGKTADDHIRIAVAADGKLYVAMKNSRDEEGQPQLVLRVRDTQGKWTSKPYAPRTKEFEPSRPIVLIGGRPERVLLLHSHYVKATKGSRIMLGERVLMDIDGHLNDVTGTKARLPEGQPWIVLASDKLGNVYEGRIDVVE